MKPQPPIPEPLWNTVPAEAQVAILAVLESLKGRIAELEQRVGDLEGRLSSTPPIPPSLLRPIPSGSNASLPPDPPVGNGVGNRDIAGHSAAWSRRRRCARSPIVGPRIAVAAVKPWPVTTRLLWFTRSPSCPRSNRWSTSTDFIALPAPTAA